MRRVESLPWGGHSIICEDGVFPLGLDTLALCSFVKLKGGHKICDLGCGGGVMPVIFACKNESVSVDGVEINPMAAELAAENVKLNGFCARIEIIRADFRDPRALRQRSYDAVVSNPPYMRAGAGARPRGPGADMARREICATIYDVCRASARILKPGGSLYLVYRTDRLADLFDAMRQSDIAPRSVRFICHDTKSPPRLVLMSGKLGAKADISAQPNLYVKDGLGGDTPEMRGIFGGEDGLCPESFT